jgi:hypothetical protein
MSIYKLPIAVAIDYHRYRLKKTTDNCAVVFDFIRPHLPNDLLKTVGNKRRYIEE